ncbi:hypothetical protein ACU8M5_09250 [Rhizobium leguminosarum]
MESVEVFLNGRRAMIQDPESRGRKEVGGGCASRTCATKFPTGDSAKYESSNEINARQFNRGDEKIIDDDELH